MERLSPAEEQILLILGRANLVKHSDLLESIEYSDTWAVDSEDVKELINHLLELSEQVRVDICLSIHSLC